MLVRSKAMLDLREVTEETTTESLLHLAMSPETQEYVLSQIINLHAPNNVTFDVLAAIAMHPNASLSNFSSIAGHPKANQETLAIVATHAPVDSLLRRVCESIIQNNTEYLIWLLQQPQTSPELREIRKIIEKYKPELTIIYVAPPGTRITRW